MPGSAARTHGIVIPTALRRPDLLEQTLAALARQSLQPTRIHVVSTAPVTLPGALVIVADRAGTAHQRNLGLAVVQADVVHFIDDDVVIDPGYLAAIDRCYDDPRVVGATGNLTRSEAVTLGLVGPRIRHHLRRGTGSGRVSPGGVAHPIEAALGDHDVQWMPSAVMSMRTGLAKSLGFDERLERGPTGPYALAEDLDISHRLHKHGVLRFCAAATARHCGLEMWKLQWPDYWRMRALVGRYLASKPELGFSAVESRWTLAVDLAYVSWLTALGRTDLDCLRAYWGGMTGPNPLSAPARAADRG
jgi:glycosyltransferase involved in cell wall biosynthesis